MIEPRRQVLRSRVAGFQHHRGATEMLGRMRPGARLILARQPDNPHDPNAVRVLSPSSIMLGYVPRDQAAQVARVMDRGEYVQAFKTPDTFNSFDIVLTMGDPLL